MDDAARDKYVAPSAASRPPALWLGPASRAARSVMALGGRRIALTKACLRPSFLGLSRSPLGVENIGDAER